MRIALFTDTYEPEVNGVATSVRTLREGLIARGHEVTVFCPSHPDATWAPGVMRLPSIAFRPIHERRLATPVDLRVTSYVKEGGFDIIHTHTEFSVGQFGFRAASQLKIPHVHTYHTMYEEYTWYVTRGLFESTARKLVRRVSRYVCSRCDRVIAPTQKTKNALLSYGILTPISVVATGVDIERFRTLDEDEKRQLEELRVSLGLANKKILLSLGRVANEKRILELIEAFAAYVDVKSVLRDDVVLLVVGNGPAEDAARSLVGELGISERVVFAGEVMWEDTPLFYHLGDVFVSMSESETQGLTYIESLAAGTPIVAQYNECFDGILEEGVSASLFRDPSEFPARIDTMLFSEKRNDYIAGATKAVESVSLQGFARLVDDIYVNVRKTYVPHVSRLRRILP